MRIHRLMAAATLTLLAALAAASPASAKPGNGAEVVNRSYCLTFDYGTVCFYERSVHNSTETPSGNVSQVANGRSGSESTGAEGCDYSSASNDFKYHALTKDGTTHVQGSRGGGESSFDCFGTHYDCTFKYHDHYANGREQFDRREYECTPTDPPV